MSDWDDKIEKTVELEAPVDRVWEALTDHRQFGEWFKVALDQPFEAGARSTGKMTYPGYEGIEWLAHIESIEPKRLFAMRWHDPDPQSDLPLEEQPTTLVEFLLTENAAGTMLLIRESGFASYGDERGKAAMKRNTGGWEVQATNIIEYVSG
ncbi:MAG: SRPBCC family protein [Pseudomonadota bacterium]